jgi:hypothetical protein
MKTALNLGLILFHLLSFAQQPESTGNPMQSLLPTSLREWTVSEGSRFYPGRKIFEYMDGAGEVYLAYNFRDLLVQRYTCPEEEEILVELYDMGLPRNAFGVFTYMLGRGPALPIGQDAEYKSGLLCFWKGRYFAYVKIENESEKAKKALLELGMKISNAIREEGERPAILHSLPRTEYLPGSLRYFFRHEILESHYSVGEGNPLLLNENTEAVLVRMKRDRSYLLLVKYPLQGEADSAYENFLARCMPDAGTTGVARRENGKWTACVKRRNYVAIVFDAGIRRQATNLLERVERKLP